MNKALLFGAVACIGVFSSLALATADGDLRVAGAPTESRAFLGIQTNDVPRTGGVEVQVKGILIPSPAANSKIQVGDFITKFDGTVVTNTGHLRELVREQKPGDRVIVTVNRAPRDRDTFDLPVVLGEREARHYGLMR